MSNEIYAAKQIAEPLAGIAVSLKGVSDALHALGTNHAVAAGGSPMGAIELLAMEVRAGSQRMADSLAEIAEAIREFK